MVYTTNQPSMVACAKKYYKEYPTIVNNIPKDKNKYNNAMKDFAIMDNMLAGSQRDIGESSNLAQICQSYASCLNDKRKYNNYIAILSTIAQISIDSAKRRFDMNIPEEIALIKKNMEIDKNGYPKFWSTIKRGFDKSKINKELTCPMNYIQDIKTINYYPKVGTIPFCEFLEPIDSEVPSVNTVKRIEDMIEQYSLELYLSSTAELINTGDYEWNSFLLLRTDFDDLINTIRSSRVTKRYNSLVKRLLNRAFVLEPTMLSNKKKLQSKTHKNKALLMKILYNVNPTVFLSCFKKSLNKVIAE